MHPKAGWILSGILGAYLIGFDAATKIAMAGFVVTGTVQFGIPTDLIRGTGITLAIVTVLYLIPRTIFLGSLLLTAYLGGAVLACVRMHSPIGLDAVPIIFCILIWVGTFLRDPRYKNLLLE